MDTLTTLITILCALIRDLEVANHERVGLGSLREQIGFRQAVSLRKQLNRLAADLQRAGVDLVVAPDRFRHGADATREPVTTLHAYNARYSTREPDLAAALEFALFLEARVEAHLPDAVREEARRELAALNAA